MIDTSAQSPTHMSDIARKAGVSLATVSRTFNPATAHLVKETTRRRVLRVASSLKYTPNRSASALSSGSTKTIGLVFPPTSHFSESTFDVSVLTSTVSSLYARGFDLKVHFLSTTDTTLSPTHVCAHLAVDGLIFAGIPHTYSIEHAGADTHANAVLLSSYSSSELPSIDADNHAAGRTAAEYFLDRGHTRPGILAGPDSSQNAVDRMNGFLDVLHEHSISIPATHCVHCNYGCDDGARAAHTLFSSSPPPTAVFCVSDEIALGALRTLRTLSLACPHDVSLIGFDNAAATAHTTPPLTTFSQPFDRMIPAAVSCLLDDTLPETRVFPATLIERDSVADNRKLTR